MRPSAGCATRPLTSGAAVGVDQDLARRWFVHLGERAASQCGLPRAVLPDDRDHRAGRQVQRDVLQARSVSTGIGKGHTVQADAVDQLVGTSISVLALSSAV